MTTTTATAFVPGARFTVLEHPSSHGDGFATGTEVYIVGPNMEEMEDDGVLVTTHPDWENRAGQWSEGVTAYVRREWLQPIEVSQPVTRAPHEFRQGDRVRFTETYEATPGRVYAEGTEGMVNRTEASQAGPDNLVMVRALITDGTERDTWVRAGRLALITDPVSQPVTPIRRELEFFVGDRVRMVQDRTPLLRGDLATVEGPVAYYGYDPRRPRNAQWSLRADDGRSAHCWPYRFELVEGVSQPVTPAREPHHYEPGDRVRLNQPFDGWRTGDTGTIARRRTTRASDQSRSIWDVNMDVPSAVPHMGSRMGACAFRFDLITDEIEEVEPTREEDGVTLHLVQECDRHSRRPHHHVRYEGDIHEREGWNPVDSPPIPGSFYYLPGVFAGRGSTDIGRYVRAPHAVTAGTVEAVPTPEGLVEAVNDSAKATVLRAVLDAMDALPPHPERSVSDYATAAREATARLL